MTEMTLEQVKQTEVEILDYINNICKKYGYKYYLAGGTLLGAVRHKGFIPWDDDIDIIMPRKQYQDFINTVQMDNSIYRVISAYNDPYYKKLFIKIVDTRTYLEEKDSTKSPNLGVYVDVFPLDVLPDNERKRRAMQNKAWYLRQIMGHAIVWEKGDSGRGIIYKMLCFFCHCFGWKRAFYMFEKMAIKTSHDTTRHSANLSAVGRRTFDWDSSCFEPAILLPFEGREYRAPWNYDEYLKGYTNYRELPPVEKRVSNHDFKAYYK